MKREYLKTKPYYINKIYPYFFWKLCEVCKKEFKKEHGWEINIPWSNNRFNTHYVCCSCISSEDKVDVFAEELMKPPPPPQRRISAPIPPKK